METEWIKLLTRTETIIFMIPIVAILVGGIITIVKMLIRHRERMALIEQGLHPDHLDEESPSEGEIPV